MILLAPGTPKYLLIDTREVDRNKERQKAGAPVVCVVEVQPQGIRLYRGYNVLAADVTLAYSQNTPLLRVRLAPDLPDTDIYAAMHTTGQVAIAEDRGEALVIETPTSAPPPPPPAEAAPTKGPKAK